MPDFLYRLTPVRAGMPSAPTPDEAAAAGRHLAYLQGLAAQGKLLLAGRTSPDETTFGIAILRAADEAEARAMMERDPGVTSGIMRAELFGFSVAVASPGPIR